MRPRVLVASSRLLVSGVVLEKLLFARLRYLFLSAVVVCLLFIVLSFLGRSGIASASALWQFNLGNENNLAAWWSGALLAVIALCASDGAYSETNKRNGTAKAWLVISGVFLFLSADEVGSLHERLSLLGKAVGVGSWGLLLLLGTVLAALMGWSLLRLWLAGGSQRRKVWPISFALALFGLVVLQEFVEHAVAWNGEFVNSLRLILEEGTELIALLILFRVVLCNTGDVLSEEAPNRRALFGILSGNFGNLLVVLLLLAPVVTVISTMVSDGMGEIALWFASMLFLGAGAIPLRHILEERGSSVEWVLAALCLLASAFCVAINGSNAISFGGFETSKKAIVLLIFCISISVNWLFNAKLGTKMIATSVLLNLVLITPLLPPTSVIVYLLPIVLGFVVFYGQVALGSEQGAYAENGQPSRAGATL